MGRETEAMFSGAGMSPGSVLEKLPFRVRPMTWMV